MDRNLAYEWYRRHGLRYFIGAPLFETKRYHLMWSFQRAVTQGHAQAKDVELFELLKPHVSCALALADQIGTLRSFDRFGSAMLDALPYALFALDGAGRILFTNSKGDAALAAADGLCSTDGRLSAAVASDQPALLKFIREAALVDIVTSGGWTRVSRLNGGPPYAVFVSPLNIADEELLASSATVLVIAHDSAEHRQPDAAMLASLYGLTDAEARLAGGLSVGHSLESAAAKFGISVATAKSQLKSVFRKVGVNRQQDLVRVLMSLPLVG
jgi:DNA-binding CsgD family transcriptional regulator